MREIIIQAPTEELKQIQQDNYKLYQKDKNLSGFEGVRHEVIDFEEEAKYIKKNKESYNKLGRLEKFGINPDLVVLENPIWLQD